MTSKTTVDLSLERQEVVILGTQYAGEMKKAVFTLMNYLMPKRGVLSMHWLGHCRSSDRRIIRAVRALGGRAKTTLSADPKRELIGDDEHGWSDTGIFNIEGGCYAKAIYLTREAEPQIFDALRFGAVLENVVYDESDHHVDFADSSITENTRGAYPIEFIPNIRRPCVAPHPKHVIFLTCDAFGVLPPVSRLTPEQAEYHFISGYTAKVAGTEVGVTEPQATFSPLFRRTVSRLASAEVRLAPVGEDRRTRGERLVGQYWLERWAVRRRPANQAGQHPGDSGRDTRWRADARADRAGTVLRTPRRHWVPQRVTGHPRPEIDLERPRQLRRGRDEAGNAVPEQFSDLRRRRA